MDHQDFRRRIANEVEDLLTQYAKARELFAEQMKRYEELWQTYLKKDSEVPQPDEDPLAIAKYPSNAPDNRENWLKYLKDRNALEKFIGVKENLPKYLNTDGEYHGEDFEYDGNFWYARNEEEIPHPYKLCTWGGFDEVDILCCYYGLLARLYDVEKPNAPYRLCPDSLKTILDEIPLITKKKLLISDDTFELAIKFVGADIKKSTIPVDAGDPKRVDKKKTEIKSYLEELYKKDINQDQDQDQDLSKRVYGLLDYAEEILINGFRNPENKKLHEHLLKNFSTESQCVKRLTTDDLFTLVSIPLQIKTTFQKDFANYILNIRDWMKKSAHSEEIDLWERERLGDIRDGLFEQWIGFLKTYNYKIEAECKVLKAENEARQEIAAAESLLATGNSANKTKPKATQTKENMSAGTDRADSKKKSITTDKLDHKIIELYQLSEQEKKKPPSAKKIAKTAYDTHVTTTKLSRQAINDRVNKLRSADLIGKKKTKEEIQSGEQICDKLESHKMKF